MLELFTNPGYLAAAAALISVPIIIHLINRMRFKRLRWAAMEFLLKSQKRNRRRLIIEQLLLLLLRCTLVFLAGLLVLRFVGFSFAMFNKQNTLHVVILDDTVSMNDRSKVGGVYQSALDLARGSQDLKEHKNGLIMDKIVRMLGQSSTSERLMILPLSKLAIDPNYQPTIYEHLNDKTTADKIREDLSQIPPGKLHVNLRLVGIKKAQQILEQNPEGRVAFHLISDYRECDWRGSEAEALHKAVLQLVQDKERVKLWMDDVAHPARVRGTNPIGHDNVGIVDLHASTRVAGKNMPVTFTITITNFSAREAPVNLVVFDERGVEHQEIDPTPSFPLKIRPQDTVSATFDIRFNPEIKPGQKYFAQIGARLESPQRGELENDGLPDDNVRYAAVEVRNKVPILVIDGKGREGRRQGGDSFFLEIAMRSVPGGSYELVYADSLGGGEEFKGLERSDLSQYPVIILANVRELSAKLQANLETYVREGGGVAFFLGPQVSSAYYNKNLYKDGKGIFPAPLAETFTPSPSQEPRQPAYTGDFQVLLRDEQFHEGTVPIFGQVFKRKEDLAFLKDLPIHRYFEVPRARWHPEPGRVFELATLANDQPAIAFQKAVVDLMKELPLGKEEYRPYWPALQRHREEIKQVVQPGSTDKAFKLAAALDALLTDRGDEKKREEFPNLTELWKKGDPKIRSLRDDIKGLRDLVLYGDPLVVAGSFGKGRVVAVMTTAGKEWNDWGGGSDAQFIYEPFIWEMVDYLSSHSSDSNLAVGARWQIDVDATRFKGNENLKMVRTFSQPREGKPVEVVPDVEQFGSLSQGTRSFVFDRTLEPGFYLADLVDNNADRKVPLASYGQTFNVDTTREGNLQRITQEEMDRSILSLAPPGTIVFEGPQGSGDQLVNRQTDISESPWLFLVFLVILVAEQALAVHLSFHLKGSEAELPAQVSRTQTQAA